MNFKLNRYVMIGSFLVTMSCCLVAMFPMEQNLRYKEAETPAPPPAKSAPESSGPQSNVICPMEWVSPTTSFDAGQMPPSGVLPMDWTDNPGASDYDMTVVTPNGSSVDYDVDGSSKDLFLENFSQTGDYQVVVTALDADGNPLCSITMNFNMPVATAMDPLNPQQSGDTNGDGNNPSSNNPVIPLIVVEPPPTKDVP